jgi:hypothetical protein
MEIGPASESCSVVFRIRMMGKAQKPNNFEHYIELLECFRIFVVWFVLLFYSFVFAQCLCWLIWSLTRSNLLANILSPSVCHSVESAEMWDYCMELQEASKSSVTDWHNMVLTTAILISVLRVGAITVALTGFLLLQVLSVMQFLCWAPEFRNSKAKNNHL